MDDRGAHVLAGQGQGLVGFRADLQVQRVVLQRLGEGVWEPDRGEDRSQERGRAPVVQRTVPAAMAGGWVGVEDVLSQGGVERSYYIGPYVALARAATRRSRSPVVWPASYSGGKWLS